MSPSPVLRDVRVDRVGERRGLLEVEHVRTRNDDEMRGRDRLGQAAHPFRWSRKVCGTGDAGDGNVDVAERRVEIVLGDGTPPARERVRHDGAQRRLGIADAWVAGLGGECLRREPTGEGGSKDPLHARALRRGGAGLARRRVRGRAGACEHERVDHFGVADGEVLGDHRPHRDTDNVEGRRNVERGHLVCHRGERQRTARGSAATESRSDIAHDRDGGQLQPLPTCCVEPDRWNEDESHNGMLIAADEPEET